MASPELKILIASTEKTGNTWLKVLLAQIYDLPIAHIGFDFSPSDLDSLGKRWIIHQHLLPEKPLLSWAIAHDLRFITTIRHPGDILVSLYHYCLNYPAAWKDDAALSRAIAVTPRDEAAQTTHQIVDGELVRLLQDRLIADLNISASWMVKNLSYIVRYEDLRTDPLAVLRNLTGSLAPAQNEQMERAIADCEITQLRERNVSERRFFRRGQPGEWRVALPAQVRWRFAEEEPFKSQCAFLGYDVSLSPEDMVLPPTHDMPNENNSWTPLLRQLLASVAEEKRGKWRDEEISPCAGPFVAWANSPANAAEADLRPFITNLTAFIHQQAPDLQRVFPDIFGDNRLGFASWFLRHAGYEYQLDRRFLTPVALSWIANAEGSLKCV
jgi:hypothetical protein